MVEDFARSNAGVDNAECRSAKDSQPVDFRVQAALDAFGPQAAGTTGSCCDKSKKASELGDIIDFAPERSGGKVAFGQRKSLAAAFGDMMNSAGIPNMFSARAESASGEGDAQDRREDRKKAREDRREQRRENIKNLFDNLKNTDLSAITNMLKDLKLSPELQKAIQNGPEFLKGLQQAPELLKGLQTFMTAMQGVESVKFNKTDDGKLGVTITRKDENKIDINKEQPGPPKVTVNNVTIGKEVSFNIGKDGDNYKLDKMSGIKINSTVDVPKILGGPKVVDVDLKSATLDKDKDGKSVIKAQISNPILPNTTIPVVVPLSPEAKK